MPKMCPDMSRPQIPRHSELPWGFRLLVTDGTKDQADKRESGTKIGGEVLSKAQCHGVMQDDKLLGARPAWKMLRACSYCGLDCREWIRAVKHGLI